MGKLFRIRALSETLAPTTPVWTAVPVPVIFAGTAGSYTLPVSNAVSASWVGPGSKPAWLSFVDASPPRITWTAAATVQDIDAVVLRAANATGQTADTAPFRISVQAAPVSTGFFANYLPIAHTAMDWVGDNDNGPVVGGKQSRMIAHPSGRHYFFGGDTDLSGEQRIWSLNPGPWNTATPSSGWRLEHPYFPLTGNYFPTRTDCQSNTWDSKRRVFWLVAGYSAGSVPGTVPAGTLPFADVVAKFDPAKAKGTQWTPTAAQFRIQGVGTWGGEYVGPAMYDPVLDYVIHGGDATGKGAQLHFFDPATETYAFSVEFSQSDLYIPSHGWLGHVIAIDPVNRWLWLMRSYRLGGNETRNIYRITLPNSRTGLPAAGVTLRTVELPLLDWTSRATSVWSNPSNGLIFVGANTAIMDGQTRKWYGWLRGSLGAEAGSLPGALPFGNNFKYGTCGHPVAGNGNYGSANTGVLVDLMTGALEYTQAPLMQYDDGLGWIIPNQTYYSEKTGRLVYFGADEAVVGTAGAGVSNKHYELRRKATPGWMAAAPLYQWVKAVDAPNVSISSTVRTRWSGTQAQGGSEALLGGGKGPFQWSAGTFRQKDSVFLFHSGGGDDGNGNGILGLQLNADTPTWVLPKPPTRAYQRSGGLVAQNYTAGYGTTDIANPRGYNTYWDDGNVDSIDENGQKTPVAVHAYTSAQFIDSIDTWIRFGTVQTWPGDNPPTISGQLDCHAFQWSEMSKPQDSRLWSLNFCPPKLLTSAIPGDGHVKHPWREDVLYARSGNVHMWRAATNTHIGYLADGGTNPGINGFQWIDPAADVAVNIGTPGVSAPMLIDLGAANIQAASAAIYGHATNSWGGPNGAEFVSSALTDSQYTWDDDNQCVWAIKCRWAAPRDTSFDLWKITLVNKATCTFSVTKITTTGTKPAYGSVINVDAQGDNENTTCTWSRELGGLVVTQGQYRPIHFIKTSARP